MGGAGLLQATGRTLITKDRKAFLKKFQALSTKAATARMDGNQKEADKLEAQLSILRAELKAS